MSVIVFDIDDTLGDFVTPSLPIFNKKFNSNLTYEDINTPAFHSLLGISSEDVAETIVEHKILESITPVPHAIDILKICKSAGLTPVYCTSRGFHPKAHEVTFNWLETHDAPEGPIVVTKFGQSKADAIKTLYDSVVAFVDDNYDHIRDFINEDIADNVIMINRPWNQQYSHKYRISCISELLELLR